MKDQLGTSVDFEKFTWRIEDFSKQNTMKLCSKPFKIRGYTWRIHVYPLRRDVKHFSMHLMVADSLPPYGWSRNTFFKLALINQIDRRMSIVKVTQQKFNGGHRSWGSFFLNLRDFDDHKQGYLVGDTCIIEVHICVSNFAPDIQDNKVTPTLESRLFDTERETLEDRETHGASTSRSSPTDRDNQVSELTLKDLIDLEKFGPEFEPLVPLLEEVCIWHPSLIQSQKESTEGFKLWAFTSLGRVLHFLKTRKVRDITDDDCKNLEGWWKELVKSSGFDDLAWLEPYVQSALGVKEHLKRANKLRKLKDYVVGLEIKMKKLRGELAAAEAEFKVARKGLSGVRKGFQKMDINSAIGYAMF